MYAVCDAYGRQYHHTRPGLYISTRENIPYFYDLKGLCEFVSRVEVPPENTLEPIRNGYYTEKAVLKEGKSLLYPQTYYDLEIKPHPNIVKKSILVHLDREDVNILCQWWRYARNDKDFFRNYIDLACSRHKFQVLRFWTETAREENFSLQLWGIAEKYRSSPLTDWFFRLGVETQDYAYCRLGIEQALVHDKGLLDTWRDYILDLVKSPSYVGEVPDKIKRVVEKSNILFMFGKDYGDYRKPNYNIVDVSAEGKEEDLEKIFQDAACFRFTYAALDKASEKGNMSSLSFWMKKALRYGKEFLPYWEALDLAAFKGEIEVLHFWSYASALFSFPLSHTQAFLRYAVLQGRVDILRWWEKYSGKCLDKSLVYLAVKQDKVEVLKFFVSLGYGHRKHWTEFGRLLLRCCSDPTKKWWLEQGQRDFLTV